jgi:hypothetical protein
MVDVFEWEGELRKPKQFHRSGVLLPDYLNDLNAMAEAESALFELNADNFGIYWRKLQQICARSPPGTPIFRATAAQRAEAFLRLLNLWTDDESACMH